MSTWSSGRASRDEHVGLLIGGESIFTVAGGAVTMSGSLAAFGPPPCAVWPRLAPDRGLGRWLWLCLVALLDPAIRKS
jgi:hypothetical protein